MELFGGPVDQPIRFCSLDEEFAMMPQRRGLVVCCHGRIDALSCDVT